MKEKRKGWLWFGNALAVVFFLVGVRDFLRRVWRRMWWVSRVMSEHWCEVNVCVHVSVLLLPVLNPLLNLVGEVDLPSFSVFDCECVQPQTLSFSRKRGASVAPECETKMNNEGLPIKAVPESEDPRRRVRFLKPCQNVCEAERPEGTPLQQTATGGRRET